MANKKTTTAKTQEVKEVAQAVVPQKREVTKEDKVDVMNFTFGTLIYINKRTGETFEFEGYGASDVMTVGELAYMKTTQPKFLTEPWLIILDEDVVQYLGLSKLYENILQPEQIEEFFNMSEDNMVKFLEKAPTNMRTLIASITRQKYLDKQFGDIFKIKLIENALGCIILED